MSDFSLFQTLLIFFGGIGGTAGAVALLSFLAGRYDKLKENKKKVIETHTTLSIESRRLDLQEDEHTSIELWKIIDEKKTEIDTLKLDVKHFADVIKQLNTDNSLSRTTVTKLYTAARALRRQINQIDKLVDEANCEHQSADLRNEMDKLKTSFDELEACLP